MQTPQLLFFFFFFHHERKYIAPLFLHFKKKLSRILGNYQKQKSKQNSFSDKLRLRILGFITN